MINPLDKVFSDLCDGFKDLIKKNIQFKAKVDGIEAKLKALEPGFRDMVKSNEVLDRPSDELKDLEEVMESGIKLTVKCSKSRWWEPFWKYKYAIKLTEWEKRLDSQLVILNLHTARDVKEIAVVVKNVETLLGNTAFGYLPGQQLIEEKLEIGIQNPPGEPKAWMSTEEPEVPRFTVGLDKHLKELKMKLLKDGGSMLVITAPGGSGKTTLATMFYHDHEVTDKFTKNIFVTVSTKSNYIVVQELCQKLGSQESTFPNEDGAFSWLKEFLKETSQIPLLLILDDVWSKSESLLEKFNELSIQSNFSILVTSRSSFPSFGSQYPLDALNHKDAMTLFRHSAIRGDKSYNVPENLQDKIVRRCKGCPLAIEVVGKSLCGKFTESWLKKLSDWSKGASIFDTETEVLLCLKSSLDALDEKDQTIKECFLDLGAFPEDQRIPAVALIDMWAELYGLDEDFLSIQYLQELSSRSLANLVVTRKEKMEADGYYSEHFVSQHDVLRDLAIFQAKLDPNKTRLILDKCGDKIRKKLTEQKHQSFQTRILSISSDGVFSTDMHKIQLSDVEVLVLNFQSENYALPKFVAEMKNLKVLIVTNNGSLPAELSNFQLLDSLPNLKRIRLERISIPSITKNPIQLKSLKKISFFMCSISQAFSNSSFQISYAFPKLEELNIDYCSDLVELSGDLSDLIELNKLSITHCHKLSALPKEIGKLIKLVVLRVKSCTDLVTFPASIKNLENLQFLDISDCFSIKELPDDIGEISTLEKINMRHCSRLQDLPLSVSDLKQLNEVICDEETKELWEIFGLEIDIRVLKEEFDLDWLSKFQS
ncbi:putative disease resistance protein [Rosa sericea]